MKTVALVGYGYWGPNLLRNYMELPGARVKWVCDSRPEALAKATSRGCVEGDSILVVGLFHSARRPATTAATLEDRAGRSPDHQ